MTDAFHSLMSLVVPLQYAKCRILHNIYHQLHYFDSAAYWIWLSWEKKETPYVPMVHNLVTWMEYN